MLDWMPYAVSALVLLWGLGSFAMAASGGRGAGLHETADTRAPSEATVRRRRERTFRAYAALNYLLGLAVIAAAIALFGAAIFLG